MNYTAYVSIDGVPLGHEVSVLDVRVGPHRLPDELRRELRGAVLGPGIGPLDLVLRHGAARHLARLALWSFVAVMLPSTLLVNHAQ